jgi:hypothetical protein
MRTSPFFPAPRELRKPPTPLVISMDVRGLCAAVCKCLPIDEEPARLPYEEPGAPPINTLTMLLNEGRIS